MGAGAASAQFPLFSPRAGNTTDDGGAMPTSSRSAPPQPTAAAGRNRQVRQRIFDRAGSVVDGKAGMSRREREKTVDIDPVTRSMLEEAFSGLYFLQGADDDKSKMDMVIDSMDKEEFSKDDLLITEGESGNKLYVVEDGELEVTINGEVIRHMGKGTMLGELALLYDAPRTATVRCMTKCTVWSLGRQVFKQIQAASASDVDVQRARWLINSPELAVLSAIDLSRLVGVMKVVHFSAGDQLYKENQLTNQCLLIEKGNAKVFVSIEPGGMAIEEVDNILGLTRPAGTGEKVGGSSEGLQGPSGFFACDLFSGCLVGIGILRGKAQMADCWRWVGVAELEKAGRRGDAEGADPPCTIIAQTDMQCLSFTVDVFENLFGPISKVLQPKTSLKSTTSPAGRQPKTQERKFDSTKFKLKYVLGSGSFGIVTLAEYRDGSGPAETFALKSLSKVAVIETGQLRHVLDERKLLSLMSNKFIMRLFGTYQTPHQLVMVSEPLNCGDLWCVIYETMPYSENQGLSIALAKVYVAILVLGLAHIHEKGIVYRDLKPENIMLDEKGYLRIIDFGFAKRVPYTKVDSRGELRVHAKTYTLCGTPGRRRVAPRSRKKCS